MLSFVHLISVLGAPTEEAIPAEAAPAPVESDLASEEPVEAGEDDDEDDDVVEVYIELANECPITDETTTVADLAGKWPIIAFSPMVSFFLPIEQKMGDPILEIEEGGAFKYTFSNEVEDMPGTLTDVRPGALHHALPNEFDPFPDILETSPNEEAIENMCIRYHSENMMLISDRTGQLVWFLVNDEKIEDDLETEVIDVLALSEVELLMLERTDVVEKEQESLMNAVDGATGDEPGINHAAMDDAVIVDDTGEETPISDTVDPSEEDEEAPPAEDEAPPAEEPVEDDDDAEEEDPIPTDSGIVDPPADDIVRAHALTSMGSALGLLLAVAAIL